MTAAISVAMIRNTAYNVIKTQEVQRITNEVYDLEEYNKFAKTCLQLPRQSRQPKEVEAMDTLGSSKMRQVTDSSQATAQSR